MPFRVFPLISAALLCGSLFLARPQVATTGSSAVRSYVFPPVGLGTTETASVTVVNSATSAATAVTPTTPSCTGAVSFTGANGAIGTPVSFTVAPGAFKTVTLPFASAGLTGIRGEIQAKVSVTIAPSTPCSVTFSLETYDSTTGATHVLLTNTAASISGPPYFPIISPGGRMVTGQQQ